MIRINLLGTQEGAQLGEQRKQMRTAGGVLAANAVAAVLLALAFNRIAASRGEELASINSQIQAKLKVVQDVEDEEHKRAVLQEKRRVIEELKRRSVGPLKILTTLSEAPPNRLWLNEFVDTAGLVTITGLAVDDPTVARFLSRLQGSPHFKGLQLVETAQAQEGQTTAKKFVMKGPLDYSGITRLAAVENGKKP